MTEHKRMPVDATGKWRTTTRSGTTHDWDMDAFTIKRNPHANSHNYGMSETFNERVHPIRSIACPPIVGERFTVFLVDTGSYLLSNTVVKIEKLSE
jgi:hypothetical protein